MGCYLEDYRARVGSWARKVSWRGVPRRGDADGKTGEYLGLTVLSSVVLAMLLITGGVEQNPGPVVEVDKHLATFMYWVRKESKVGNPM